MDLDFAIKHAEEAAARMASSCDAKERECGKEHQQLANWLKELRTLRTRISLVRMTDFRVSSMTTPNQIRDMVIDDILGLTSKRT